MQEEDAPNTFNLLNGKSLPIFISKQVILFNWHFGIQVSEKVYCVQKIIRVQQLWARSARREKCKKEWLDWWDERRMSDCYGLQIAREVMSLDLMQRIGHIHCAWEHLGITITFQNSVINEPTDIEEEDSYTRVSMEINWRMFANFSLYWHPLVCPRYLLIAGDNDDAWAGARQLSPGAGASGHSVPGVRFQSQGWDKILRARQAARCSRHQQVWQLRLRHSHWLRCPPPRSISGSGSSVSASSGPPPHLWLREMSASSGSGGSGATQPPEPLQSLLSLSPRLRAELLLTLLVAGPSLQESRRSSLNIDEEATHYSGCLNTQQWPHLLIVIVRDSFFQLSP